MDPGPSASHQAHCSRGEVSRTITLGPIVSLCHVNPSSRMPATRLGFGGSGRKRGSEQPVLPSPENYRRARLPVVRARNVRFVLGNSPPSRVRGTRMGLPSADPRRATLRTLALRHLRARSSLAGALSRPAAPGYATSPADRTSETAVDGSIDVTSRDPRKRRANRATYPRPTTRVAAVFFVWIRRVQTTSDAGLRLERRKKEQRCMLDVFFLLGHSESEIPLAESSSSSFSFLMFSGTF